MKHIDKLLAGEWWTRKSMMKAGVVCSGTEEWDRIQDILYPEDITFKTKVPLNPNNGRTKTSVK